MQPLLARTLRTTRVLIRKTPSRTLHTTIPDPDLSGVHCVITGASSGIGRATARLLASKAAQCTLLARNRTKLSETHSLLGSGAHRTVVGDVGDPETWAGKHWDEKPVHVLINAAGIAHSSLFVRTSLETVESVVRTNLMGTIMACQRLGKNMLRNESVLALGGKGCIVNVASLLAAKGAKGSSIYSASKAGVVGLTRSLALELGPGGVRTNCILPGYVQTKMTDGKLRCVALYAIFLCTVFVVSVRRTLGRYCILMRKLATPSSYLRRLLTN